MARVVGEMVEEAEREGRAEEGEGAKEGEGAEEGVERCCCICCREAGEGVALREGRGVGVGGAVDKAVGVGGWVGLGEGLQGAVGEAVGKPLCWDVPVACWEAPAEPVNTAAAEGMESGLVLAEALTAPPSPVALAPVRREGVGSGAVAVPPQRAPWLTEFLGEVEGQALTDGEREAGLGVGVGGALPTELALGEPEGVSYLSGEAAGGAEGVAEGVSPPAPRRPLGDPSTDTEALPDGRGVREPLGDPLFTSGVPVALPVAPGAPPLLKLPPGVPLAQAEVEGLLLPVRDAAGVLEVEGKREEEGVGFPLALGEGEGGGLRVPMRLLLLLALMEELREVVGEINGVAEGKLGESVGAMPEAVATAPEAVAAAAGDGVGSGAVGELPCEGLREGESVSSEEGVPVLAPTKEAVDCSGGEGVALPSVLTVPAGAEAVESANRAVWVGMGGEGEGVPALPVGVAGALDRGDIVPPPPPTPAGVGVGAFGEGVAVPALLPVGTAGEGVGSGVALLPATSPPPEAEEDGEREGRGALGLPMGLREAVAAWLKRALLEGLLEGRALTVAQEEGAW